MEFAPVIIFAYNRADHFQKTVEALSKCDEARKTDLYIYSDGPKNENAASAVQAVRDAANSISSEQFAHITVVESENNKGLALSIISGVTDVINKYGRVIVLEDDSVVSPYFLKFMNGCLNYYENDHSIGSIAGFSPQIDIPSSYKNDMFLAYRSCSCAWASWKDRWNGVDWKLETFGDLCNDYKLIKRLNSNGTDRFIRLYRQVNGAKDSWSIKFGYHLVRNNMSTVYPKYSYVTNIGADNSGVHSSTKDAHDLNLDISKAISDPIFCELTVDNGIQKALKHHYSGGIISDIKRFLATKLIVFKEKRKNG